MPMSDRPDIDLDDVRRRLEAERAGLMQMSEEGADDRQPVELDQQSVGRLSRMDAMQVQAMAQALDGRRRGRLQQIAAALKRLDEGEYGYCVACGEPIPAKRLAIDLTAARCVACAR
jgi:DnaK suppressor protein